MFELLKCQQSVRKTSWKRCVFKSDLNAAMELACLFAGARRSIVLALPHKRTDDRTARDGTAIYSCVQ